MLLDSYCALRRRKTEYILTLRGHSSKGVLALVDERGLHVE
jgi:hypothetical protein